LNLRSKCGLPGGWDSIPEVKIQLRRQLTVENFIFQPDDKVAKGTFPVGMEGVCLGVAQRSQFADKHDGPCAIKHFPGTAMKTGDFFRGIG